MRFLACARGPQTHLLLLLLLLVMVSTRRSKRGTAKVVSALTTARATSSMRRGKTYGDAVRSNGSRSVKKTKVEASQTKGRVENADAADRDGVHSDKVNSAATSFCAPLVTLPEDIVLGELLCRPSKRNRSPYVGDVWVENEQREAIVHLPNLDMGGKCVPGAKICMKPARDRKGNLIGKDAVSPKYGTPKCEFIAQLLRVDESALGYQPPVWVGAHPSLGEQVAEALVGRNLLGPDFPTVESFKREVPNVGGTDMRADFLVHHKDPNLPPRVVEVKTVVDTDYAASAIPTNRTKCVFTNDRTPYVRTAIFPWGSCNQKGPDGEAVVSARAIKHVRELTRIIKDDSKNYSATVLFVVIRHDAKAFKPNIDACPSFAKYLKEARDAGVQILAKQVIWGEGDDIGTCYEGELLEIIWP